MRRPCSEAENRNMIINNDPDANIYRTACKRIMHKAMVKYGFVLCR